jgi:glutamate-1-semialdehyde 2,1-aminomutase
MNTFEDRYIKMTPKSKEIYEEAKDYLAGGVAGRAKFIRPYPLYLERVMGSKAMDVDGNTYIDMTMGAGPNILGHNPVPVIEAVKKQVDIACHTLWPTELEVRLAKKIKQHMPHMELIRFANSGSEATRTAIRAARAYTGKSKIAVFEGHFHGSDDYFLISGMAHEVQGTEAAPEPVVDCAGIPPVLLEETIVLPYNNAEASEAILRKHGKEIAALIVEPIAGTSGFGTVAERHFLETCRQVTAEEGIILIFDEIVTGFRLSLGGATEFFHIVPDMAAIGKALAGGIPIAAFGGRREIMGQVVTPTGLASDQFTKIFHSGTFTGNPVAMAAGLATLEELEKGDLYAFINELGDALRSGLRQLFQQYGILAQATGIGSMFGVIFTDQPIRNRRDILESDMQRLGDFSLGMITEGILMPIRHIGFISAAHTKEDIEQVLTAAENVLRIMEREKASL